MLLFLLGESDVDGPRTCSSCQPRPNWAVRTTQLQVSYLVGVRTGTALMSGFGRTSYEDVIRPCRAFDCRSHINRIAVRPQRHRAVANHTKPHASRRHGRLTEASGKAASWAGADGKHWCGLSESASRPDHHSNGGWHACAGFGIGATQRARTNQQQLHRWLPDKLQVRQPTLERMLRVRRSFRFIDNVQKCTQLQDLPGMPGKRTVPGLETLGSLVVLQQPARQREVARREAQ
jgi:hypothetical protein